MCEGCISQIIIKLSCLLFPRSLGSLVYTCEDRDFDRIISQTIQQYSLNKKQEIAFKLIANNVVKREKKEEVKQIIPYIGGSGGTGKSQIIKAIISLHKELNISHKLRLCAFTGTAAKIIAGSTITSLFGLRNTSISKLEKKWQGVETVILDEVSMVSAQNNAKISKNLTRAKHANPDIPYAGMDMIFFGDFIQFPPVGGTSLYNGWLNKDVPASTSNYDIDKQLGLWLWKQVTPIILLDEQMRVRDRPYQDLLNRLREGKCNHSDYLTLSARVLGNNIETDVNSSKHIIAPGNELVMEVNNLFVTKHSQTNKVFISKAVDTIKKKKVSRHTATLLQSLPSTKTDGLPSELPLYVGMPVFLTKNISTELGLTNGTTGVVTSIPLKPEERVDEEVGIHNLKYTPDYIVLKLDEITMKQLEGLEENHVPIFTRNGSFSFQAKGMDGSATINRKHFPIVPAFACTAHKSQGKTLAKVIVDLVPQKRRKYVDISFSYVPLSRVRALKDLTILRPFDFAVITKSVNPDCAAMMEEFKRKDICKDT